MRRHELKTWPGPFDEIRRGNKTHEFRKADRGFQVGDELLLQEYDPEKEAYLGSDDVLVQITAITHGPAYGIPEGFCVMSIRKPEPSMMDLFDKLTGGLNEKERELVHDFNIRKQEHLQDKATAVLNRVKILRNVFHREQQKCLKVAERIEAEEMDVETREIAARNARARAAHFGDSLQMLHQEFEEIEVLAIDQKPRCPICGQEVKDLASHFKEHQEVRKQINQDLQAGERARGIKWAAPGLPLDPLMPLDPAHNTKVVMKALEIEPIAEEEEP